MPNCLALLTNMDFYGAIMCPYTNVMGNWVYAILMLTVITIVYIRTQDIAMPAILGLIYGLAGAVISPPEFRTFYYIIIALAVTGVLYRLVKNDAA